MSRGFEDCHALGSALWCVARGWSGALMIAFEQAVPYFRDVLMPAVGPSEPILWLCPATGGGCYAPCGGAMWPQVLAPGHWGAPAWRVRPEEVTKPSAKRAYGSGLLAAGKGAQVPNACDAWGRRSDEGVPSRTAGGLSSPPPPPQGTQCDRVVSTPPTPPPPPRTTTAGGTRGIIAVGHQPIADGSSASCSCGIEGVLRDL